MQKLYFYFMAFFIVSNLSAQTPTYADDVAAILFEKCTPCHHTGGVAPFPLMTYSEAFNKASWIKYAINTGDMPPWPPNSSYNALVHDRSLSTVELQTINDWVNGGKPRGNSTNTPPQPVYNNRFQLGTPDLSLIIPTYQSKATSSSDDYVCFSLPSGLPTNRIIKSIEIIPGDASIVHHCLIYLDPAGNYATDTTSHGCTGPASGSIPLVGAFAPGSSPVTFPNDNLLKMGVNMPAGSKVVLAMHYPEGSYGKVDSTRINIHFYPQGVSGVRQVSAAPLLSNTRFTIAANTIDSVEDYYPNRNTPINANYSLYGIFPHAHLLGKSFIVYAVNHFAPYDKVPLIHIPEWDFEWQGFYVFKHMQKLPTGYKLYGKALYDNTTNNPNNPNNPPQNVSFGLNTSDEMFFIYFQYLPYQSGDENINIDSLINHQLLSSSNQPIYNSNENGLFLTAYPNPSNDWTTIHYYTKAEENIRLDIYDMSGKLIRQLVNNKAQQGEQLIYWNGTNEAGIAVPSGIYISRLQVGQKTMTQKITRIH